MRERAGPTNLGISTMVTPGRSAQPGYTYANHPPAEQPTPWKPLSASRPWPFALDTMMDWSLFFFFF